MPIVSFLEWRQAVQFACVVVNFPNGGTLAQELAGKSEVYTERRIAWYALQLMEALALAHERGVLHHNLKSSKVLLDWSSGGKLLLAGFSTAVAPGENSIGYTKSYASPELLTALAQEKYEGLQVDKIDSFGLGCIFYELLSCHTLKCLSGNETSFVQRVDDYAALDSPSVRLPWLPIPRGRMAMQRQSVTLKNCDFLPKHY